MFLVGCTSGSLTRLRKIAIGELLVGAEFSPRTAADGCRTEMAGVPAGACFNGFKGISCDIFIARPDELSDGGVGGGFKREIPTEGDVLPMGLVVRSREGPSELPAGTSAASFAVFKDSDTFLFGACGHRDVSSGCLSATTPVEGKIAGLP